MQTAAQHEPHSRHVPLPANRIWRQIATTPQS